MRFLISRITILFARIALFDDLIRRVGYVPTVLILGAIMVYLIESSGAYRDWWIYKKINGDDAIPFSQHSPDNEACEGTSQNTDLPAPPDKPAPE